MPFNFLTTYENLSILNEDSNEDSLTLLNKAINCIEDFRNYISSKAQFETIQNLKIPLELKSQEDILKLAFSVPALVDYLKNKASTDQTAYKNLQALLSIFGRTISDDYKSLQYLYNAMVQEHYLLQNFNKYLERNPKATKADYINGNLEYYFMVSKDRQTTASDFYIKNDPEVKVEAKICSSLSKVSDTKDATYVIVYLVSQNTKTSDSTFWKFLYKKDNNWVEYSLEDPIDFGNNLIKELAQKIIKCTKKLSLIDLK